MIFVTTLENPFDWHQHFCWKPVSETVVNDDKSVTTKTYWLETIERRMVRNSITRTNRWDYRRLNKTDDPESSDIT